MRGAGRGHDPPRRGRRRRRRRRARGRPSIWPAVEERVLDLIERAPLDDRLRQLPAAAPSGSAPASTSWPPSARRRRTPTAADARRPAADDGPVRPPRPARRRSIARAHHGSVSREERKHIEEALKSGPAAGRGRHQLSLELGIDMGAVDLVVQIEAPPIGRGRPAAGRPGRAPGRRRLPRRGLPEAPRRPALLRGGRASGCTTARIEELRYPRNPLDVLAQQIVAMVAMDAVARSTTWPRWSAGRRPSPSCPTRRWTRCSTCSPGATRRPPSPSCGRAWSGTAPTDLLTARPGAQRLAVTSGGTIPDRGLFGVFLAGAERAGPGRRARRGDGLRVAGRRRVPARLDLVADRGHHARPGAGLPRARARRPGCRSGRATRPAGRSSWAGRSAPSCATSSSTAPTTAAADARRRRARRVGGRQPAGLPATSSARRPGTCPTTGRCVVERFRDELGDWRLAVHCVLGAKVNGAVGAGDRPPAHRAVRRRRPGACPATTASWSGCPTMRRTSRPAPTWSRSTRTRSPSWSRSRSARSAHVRRPVPRVRGPALLLPRRDPRRRQPLWQQRQRAAQLLDVAREYADFPVTLEAARECLQDVFDVPGLVGLMRELAGPQGPPGRGRDAAAVAVRPVAAVRLRRRVPLRGDVPLAERRAAALALDSTLLGELLGRVELRELLDPEVVAETERPAAVARRAAHACATPRTRPSCCACSATCPTPSCAARGADAGLARRARRRPAGRSRSASPASRAGSSSRTPAGYRDALGVALPVGLADGVPRAGRRPARRPGRPLRPHPRRRSPRPPAPPGSGSASSWSSRRSSGSAATGRVVAGEFTPRRRPAPSGATPRCCGCCAGGRWPRCAGRSSRCRPRRWPRSCRAGSRSASSARGVEAVAAAIEQLQGVAGAGLGLGAAGAAGPGGRLLPRATSTSCAPPARWSGPAPASIAGRRRLGHASPAPDTRAAAAAAARPRAGAHGPLHEAVLDALDGGQALFFRAARRPRSARADDADAGCAARVGPGLGRASCPTTRSRPLRALLGRRRRAPRPGRRRRGPLPPPRLPGRPAEPGASLAAARGRPADRRRPLVPAARPRPRPDPAGRRARRRAARAARRGHPRAR